MCPQQNNKKMNVKKFGKCWFFGDFDASVPLKHIAAFLETGKNPFNDKGLTVVRADDSTNIYVIDDDAYDVALQYLNEFRNSLCEKETKMQLVETALHTNVVETRGKKQTYYTFGNMFGANCVLIADEKFASKHKTLGGKKMRDVELEFTLDGDVLLKKWSERN